MSFLMHCCGAANYKGCHIQRNAPDAAGQPTFVGRPQTTYSCVNSSADRNCNYDVHVLSSFRSNGNIISWSTILSTGTLNVNVSVDGDSNKLLVLVLLPLIGYWIFQVG